MSRSEQAQHNQSRMPIYVAILFAVLTTFGAAGNVSAQQWANNGNNINNTNPGNVGVGTTTPVGTLTVNASNTDFTNTGGAGTHVLLTNPNASGQSVIASFFNGTLQGKWRNDYAGNISYVTGAGSHIFFTGGDYPNGAVRMMITNNGNVGIGTTTPTKKLHVIGAIIGEGNGSGNDAFADFGKLNTVDSGEIGLQIGRTGVTSGVAVVQGAKEGVGANNIAFQPSGGSVGIGTTTPSTKLHVVGDLTVTGNIAAKYQDIAEWVPTSQKLTPGTVVVLDAERGSEVIASSQAYDTKVAGVVSARPGLTLGEAGADKVLVATTGRVRVKVNATRAPIRVGDLLVTSDRQGCAMKSEPIIVSGRSIHSPGTLIGKALEPLERGVGEIIVLLSLQ